MRITDEMKEKKSKPRSYRPRTVIEAQRRVLWLAFRMLDHERPSVRKALRTDGYGLMTWDELMEHLRGAAELRVRYPKP